MTGQIINSRAEAEQFALLRGFHTTFTLGHSSDLACHASRQGSALFYYSDVRCIYYYGPHMLWECQYGSL